MRAQPENPMKSTNSAIMEVYKRDDPAVFAAPRIVTTEMSPMQDQDTPNPIPHGYCQCGCGRKTSITKKTCTKAGRVKGQPARWIAGHSLTARVYVPQGEVMVCPICGTERYLYPSQTRQHCSRDCFNSTRRGNEYIDRGDGITEIVMAHGIRGLIDTADKELVQPYTWYSADGYIVANVVREDGNRGHLKIHLLLNIAGPGEMIDHANLNGLDNRRENLRRATRAQNIQNTFARMGGTSRFKGVCKRGPRWKAAISVNGKKRVIGYFDSEEEAAQAYDAAARIHYGEFGRMNFPEEGERAA